MLIRVDCLECGATFEEEQDGVCPECGAENFTEVYDCVCNECGIGVEGEPGDPCPECDGELE